MTIQIREVKGRRELKIFIHLPAHIHNHHKNWVPPVYMDEWKYFNPKKNASFHYCTTILLLAWKNGKAVGRCMGIINHKYNQQTKKVTARFCWLETYDDSEITRLLLEHLMAWAKQNKAVEIIGPFGFSDKDPQGFLVEGFDENPAIAAPCNFEYQVRHLENLGFEKFFDLVEYRLKVPEKVPDVYTRIIQRVKNEKFQLVQFSSRKQLKKYIKPIFTLMNECYGDIYGFQPMTEEEMKEFAKRYIAVIEPRFVKAIEYQSAIVAFIIAMPNISEGLRKAKGRILPFGIFHILRALKTSRQLDLLLGAIAEKCRGIGLDACMGAAMIESAIQSGMTVMDSHLEMEENVKVRAEMERMGGEIFKRFRVFRRKLY